MGFSTDPVTENSVPLVRAEELDFDPASAAPVPGRRPWHFFGTVASAFKAGTVYGQPLLRQWRLVAGYTAAVAIVAVAVADLMIGFPTSPAGAAFFGTLGIIGVWRYGWWGVHFVRALWYLAVEFPARRRRVSAVAGRERIDHLYAIVMSYDIPKPQFGSVYLALLRNIIEYGAPATVVASVTSELDREILGRVYRDLGSPDNIEIIVQYQEGKGKRSAMAMALRCIARRTPVENALVVFMDGDIFVPDAVLSRTIPFFVEAPGLDALTTNNDAIVEGLPVAASWYALRYAQRHILMSSMSVSERLLVLTGRFSIYRIRDAISRDFIEILENDAIDHWLHGRFALLSGDDKSSWFYLLQRRRKMLYIPDVKVVGYELLPQPNSFLSSSTQLMMRWFGNMLRTNTRAVMLGPRVCGLFTWWCLVDQRLSMWTALIGPIMALLFALVWSPVFLIYYLAWVLVTRTLMSLVAGIVWGRYNSRWPFLLYYNQLWGALLKTYVSFRLNRQGWVRQHINNGQSVSLAEAMASGLLHAAALLLLVMAVGQWSGVFGEVSWLLF